MPSKVGEADSTFVGQDAWPKGKTAPENSFLPMWKTVKKPNKKMGDAYRDTVDGKHPANQLRLVVYPIIYKVWYIPGGAGFLPSTVFPDISHP